MIITCIFSAIAFAVFVIVQTQFPWPEAAPPPISVSPAEANSLRLLSPGEFVSVVTKLTKDLRALDTSYGNEEARIMMQTTVFNDTSDKTKMQTQWSDRMKQENEIRERLNFEWQTKYRSRSRAANEDLCRRLGIIPDHRMNNSMPQNQLEARMLLTTGMLAGVYPISALADYLDSLASQVN